jgi:catechol 2,3-dioxygenase-like lactoylglutathione lyase family enzyme
MSAIGGFDHVAITVADIERSCAFYREVLDATPVLEVMKDGAALVRQMKMGGAMFSIHQSGNGIDLVARSPTVGAGDICLIWTGGIASALALLNDRGLAIVEGPSPRHTANGRPSQSVYFRDPDGNLIELMAPDPR